MRRPRVRLACALFALVGCGRCGGVTPGGATATGTSCPEGMVYVPGGTFMMGATPEKIVLPHEGPAHRVTLSPYCIDRTEVTAAAYSRCDAPGCEAPRAEVGPYCAKVAHHPQHPRNCISWRQANAYCEWRDARLPTEAQWEFAARGP
ncbi:MAG: formylglycine-generating enzyme family protein, partial [Polyangiaceae bacterium]|nr:formylglycine-generating enzyme family protein [Polyangiaceae bacterium]